MTIQAKLRGKLLPLKGGLSMIRLTPPKQVTFFISVALALVAAVIHYFNIPNPISQSGFTIWLYLPGTLLDGV